MERRQLKILLVEDNPGDARLLEEILAEAGRSGFEIKHFERCAPAVVALQNERFDVVLLDLSLPDSKGLETVNRITGAAPQVPVVIMTGLDDEETAIAAAKLGAQDYLVKGSFDHGGLTRTLRYAIERKEQELELAKKNAELERLNELKTHFLGMAAHDLRNPLSVIMTASSFLLEDAEALSEEKRQEFLGLIKSNSEFMMRLIEDLLEFARIQSGELQLELTPVDLEKLVESNVEQNRMVSANKGIAIELRKDGGLPLVQADARRIEQVLNNLLTNAVKFSHPGTRVEVRLARDGAGVRVAVQDQGQGIPKEELGKLFKPFQKTSVRSTAGERSTGLGLAICRQIVEAHHGRIWVESEVGKGSTFSFWLPVEPESAGERAVDAPAMPASRCDSVEV